MVAGALLVADLLVLPWHHYFVGELKGDRIAGDVTVTDGNNKRRFPWTATRAR